MSRKKNEHAKEENKDTRSPDVGSDAAAVDLGAWEDRIRPLRRTFPGPRHTGLALRITLDRTAYADVVAHTKDSLDSEVCGVLVGDVCEDDEGLYVHVRATIRGGSTRQGATHVTFTQETWNAIHARLEEDYTGMHIVGWYHSHPGFGVSFSDMDLFIQRNFFPSPVQFALLTDPLAGEDAVCVNSSSGILHLDRFFVEGRERKCRVPNTGQESTVSNSKANPNMDKRIEDMETRISQLIGAVDDLRTGLSRFLIFSFVLVCLVALSVVGYTIYSSMTSKYEPPRPRQYVQIPVRVGDDVVMLGVAVVDWKVPDDVNALIPKGDDAKEPAAEPADESADSPQEQVSSNQGS